ncbi:polymer-forming cytoskeletal protein [Salipaludibacillus agaradhaerens]|jgi:cytoskeletal protein CcmA (bactofilin family)|uniref:Polymer-forming cytoskeletal protein n=1 Tax=Salipaludibacillus agaradhaerens TaxID=76935 RepID=A0A9Q4FYJ0_SALAG|nr:polymer-forming cytoskeletal protein [Salipaludibacillus agaradhaerens]MCR6096406.1 polymer-forming cytoskeletal protein [Salipaludibacillus agaradhaerens]MCR6114035.1 polymer-forming cytoskeletal protein [Salipaludibacillus agaradhaerens]
MFSNKKNEKKLSEVSTIIGEETVFKGSLDVNSSVRIDGQVDGDVTCYGDVTIGKTGRVENDLKARNLFLAGAVKGNVKVEGKIHIYDTGSLEGKAEMSTIIIEEKGRFHGESIMTGTVSSTEESSKVLEIEEAKAPKSDSSS